MTAILGISAYYHDSAAALLVDGRIVAAVEEERLTRKKHDSSFPVNAIGVCLDEAGLAPDELDYIDFVGNGNGRFDVGDLRAWLIQAGELRADAPLLSLEAGYASQPESTTEGLPAVSRESAERRD